MTPEQAFNEIYDEHVNDMWMLERLLQLAPFDELREMVARRLIAISEERLDVRCDHCHFVIGYTSRRNLVHNPYSGESTNVYLPKEHVEAFVTFVEEHLETGLSGNFLPVAYKSPISVWVGSASFVNGDKDGEWPRWTFGNPQFDEAICNDQSTSAMFTDNEMRMMLEQLREL